MLIQKWLKMYFLIWNHSQKSTIFTPWAQAFSDHLNLIENAEQIAENYEMVKIESQTRRLEVASATKMKAKTQLF